MSSLNDLFQLNLSQLKIAESGETPQENTKDDSTQGLQDKIINITEKLNEVAKKLDDIPKMRKEIDELTLIVAKQAKIIQQQQQLITQLHNNDHSGSLKHDHSINLKQNKAKEIGYPLSEPNEIEQSGTTVKEMDLLGVQFL